LTLPRFAGAFGGNADDLHPPLPLGREDPTLGREDPLKTTWKPYKQHGQLDSSERNELPDSAYAFPDKRKEPLTDAKHVRNAIARFNQVEDVTDAEREQAFANIKKAADHYDVEMTASNWRELGKP
jgi:uncharacterized protein DUF6582